MKTANLFGQLRVCLANLVRACFLAHLANGKLTPAPVPLRTASVEGRTRRNRGRSVVTRIPNSVLVLGCFSLLCSSVFAQTPTPSPEPAKNETKPAALKSPPIAIRGADAHTVTQGVVRNATILLRDGKIVGIGQGLEIPAEYQIIEAPGKVVTPGFITLNLSNTGITGTPSGASQLADAMNPFDNSMRFALGVGITAGCAQLSPGGPGGRRRRAEDRFLGLEADEVLAALTEDQADIDYGRPVSLCPCCGLPALIFEPIEETPPTPITTRNHAVIKLSYGHLDGMLVKPDVFYDVVPGSLSGALNQHNWRRQITEAREYLAKLAEHEKALQNLKEGQERPRAPAKGQITDQMLALVKGEIRLRTRAESVGEIRSMVALAQELDYKLCLDGVTEGWLTIPELAESGAGVVITPRNRRDARRGEEDRSGSFVELPNLLEARGIPFAITPLSASVSLDGLAGRDLTSLALEAMFAVRGGASQSKALEALTIVPARMLGLADRLGSLEVGKDADVLLLDGPPLDYRTYVELAFVNGRQVYNRTEAPVWPVFPRPN
ncbi:MAG: amidohydrolase family protein [Planctomycetaceae bacterium]|nr:amidohydrolase family protein [Planctomycetaceae bacterium]